MKSNLKPLILLATLSILGAVASAKDIKYLAGNYITFQQKTHIVNLVNNSLIVEAQYAMNLTNNTYSDITQNEICDDTVFFSNDGFGYCILESSSSTYARLSIINGTYKKIAEFPTSSKDFDTGDAIYSNGCTYQISNSGGKNGKGSMLVFNLSSGNFTESDNLEQGEGTIDSDYTMAAVSSKGFFYASQSDTQIFSYFFNYTGSQSTLVANYTLSDDQSYKSGGAGFLLNGSTAMIHGQRFEDDSSDKSSLLVLAAAWGSGSVSNSSTVWGYNYKVDMVATNFYQVNDTHVVIQYLDSNEEDSSRYLGLFTVGTDGSLYNAGKLNMYLVDSRDDDEYVIQSYVQDGNGNLYVLTPKAVAQINLNTFKYVDIRQYGTYLLATPYYLSNGTKILSTPYGLASFDADGSLTNFQSYALDAAYLDYAQNTMYYIQEGDVCSMLTLNLTSLEYNTYTFKDSCDCDEYTPYIQSTYQPNKDTNPKFVYSCSYTYYSYGELYYFDGTADEDHQSTEIFDRVNQDIIFVNYTTLNMTSLEQNHKNFVIRHRNITDPNPNPSGKDYPDIQAANKIDDETFIFASQATGQSKTTVGIMTTDGQYLFNETVDKPGISLIIPLGYANVKTKILGFLFVDSGDYDLWFYNIQDKDQMIQTGFGSSEIDFNSKGNGTVIFNTTNGIQYVNYYNITDFGLSGGSLVAVSAFMMVVIAFMALLL